MRTTQITTDISALQHNIRQVKKIANKAKLMVMLKSNAYGHGLDVCTMALLASNEVSAIGVASMQEALVARKLGWNRTIVLIEGVFSYEQWQAVIDYDIQAVIHHQQQLDWALKLIPSSDSQTRTIWLKHNTGMNRLGFASDEVLSASQTLAESGYKQILTSHFANADIKDHPLNAIQGNSFADKLNEIKEKVDSEIQGSLCNSAGLVNFPDWHYDWVRAGIIIYGSSPVADKTAFELNLLPAMSLSCKVISISDIEVGAVVGYGSRWIAENDSKIAIISIGYGDGYPRVVDDTAYVIVNTSDDNKKLSYRCPIVGRVSMDMVVIDITACNNDICINDDVIMWGQKPHVDDIAAAANTIGYELLCRLTSRPQRLVRA